VNVTPDTFLLLIVLVVGIPETHKAPRGFMHSTLNSKVGVMLVLLPSVGDSNVWW
jgi:hypothetical protein